MLILLLFFSSLLLLLLFFQMCLSLSLINIALGYLNAIIACHVSRMCARRVVAEIKRFLWLAVDLLLLLLLFHQVLLFGLQLLLFNVVLALHHHHELSVGRIIAFLSSFCALQDISRDVHDLVLTCVNCIAVLWSWENQLVLKT